jgi:Flp pilus assembly protein TadD
MRTGVFESSPVDAFLQQAAAHYRAGRIVEAEKLYRQTLALRPQFAEAHSGLAVMLFLQGRKEEAVVAFRKALEIAPDDVGTLYKLGNLLLPAPCTADLRNDRPTCRRKGRGAAPHPS